MSIKEKLFPNFEDHNKQLRYEYIVSFVLLILADLIIWGFYPILLYKSTDSFSVIAIDKLFYMLALYIGFLVGSNLMKRMGYLRLYKVAFGGMGLSILLVVMFTNQISSLYPFLALAMGLPRGIMWAINHSFELKEIHKQQRARIIAELNSFSSIASVIVPFFIGLSILEFNSYRPAFLIGALLYFAFIFFPFKYNKVTRVGIEKSHFVDILTKKHFKLFALSWYLIAISAILLGIIFSVLPYMFLKSEFEVGSLMSVVSLVGGIVLYLQRNQKEGTRIKRGLYSYITFAGLTGALSLMWSASVLVIRNVISQIPLLIGLSAENELDFRNRDKVLGSNVAREGIEMNIIVETVYLFGYLTGIIVFLLVINYLSGEKLEIILRVFIALAVIIRVVSYLLLMRINTLLDTED